jgi:hypothetical protein
MTHEAEFERIILALPAAIKGWLTSEAKRNRRSRNGEIVHLIEVQMKAKQQAGKAA